MTDLSTTIAPKSDQLNADDLIVGPRTIVVTGVSRMSDPEQPIAIAFENDGGKPYKPGKSMRRVLVHAWGPDGGVYTGRAMTLYRDEKVAFGGKAVGGIRISHLSHIDRDLTMALTETRASRKPFTVKPLRAPEKPASASRMQSGASEPSAGQGASGAPPSLADRVSKAVGYYSQAADERQVGSCEAKFAPLREECASGGATDLVQQIDTARTAARARLSPSAPDASEATDGR